EWEPDLDHDEDDAPAWRNRWPTIQDWWSVVAGELAMEPSRGLPTRLSGLLDALEVAEVNLLAIGEDVGTKLSLRLTPPHALHAACVEPRRPRIGHVLDLGGRAQV